MLESVQGNTFEYERLSKDEMQQRGILGRLVGIMADCVNPTRNGRRYSNSLWEKVFEDPIMKERIENNCCFGELGHPADREETDMEKIAICMDGVPKKDKDGKLRAVFNILDTPNGRILKSLCDYGCNIGISSRGSGDLFTDYDGQEAVDPDTYNCEGWDAVIIPAVKEARLQYVTESLDKKRYNKTLRDKLTESINKEDENNQKIMRESLGTLGINLNESIPQYKGTHKDLDMVDRTKLTEANSRKAPGYCYVITFDDGGKRSVMSAKYGFETKEEARKALADAESEYMDSPMWDDTVKKSIRLIKESLLDNESLTEAKFGMFNYVYSVHAQPQGRDIILCGSKTLEDATRMGIEQAKDTFENPFMSDKEKYQYLETMYMANDDTEEVDVSYEFDEYVDNLMSELQSRIMNEGKYTKDELWGDTVKKSTKESLLDEEQIGREETKPNETPSNILNNEPKIEKQASKEDEEDDKGISLEDIFSEAYEDEEPHRPSWDTDFHRLDMAYNHSFKQFDNKEKESGVIQDFLDDLDANGKSYEIYDHKTDDGCTIFFEESLNESYNFVAKPFNFTISYGGKDMGETHSGMVVIPDALKYSDGTVTDAVVVCQDESGNEIKFNSVDEAQSWIDSYGEHCTVHVKDNKIHAIPLVVSYENTDELNRYFDVASPDDIEKEFGVKPIVKEDMKVENIFAADNDGALVEQLQNILEQNKSLEEKIKHLQEKISAGYARENELTEELDSYKQKVSKLSTKTREINVLTEKLSKANDTIVNSKIEAKDNISKLKESLSERDKVNKSLLNDKSRLIESINDKDSEIKSLTLQLNEAKKTISSKENDIEQLNEKYSIGQKDLEQIKKQYSTKFESQNKLIEKYQAVAKNSVKRYIESRAVTLGVKSEEITNRLPKKYSFDDIDTICEDLREYKFNMSNLPFSNSILKENMKVSANNINNDKRILYNNPDDELTDYDIKIAEAFL